MTAGLPFRTRSARAGFAALASALSLLACSASPGARSNDMARGGAGSGGGGGALAGAGGSMSGTGGGSGAAAGGGAGASAGSSAGGSAGAAGGGSGGVASDPCAGATVCDDFEASTFDSAWSIQMSSTPPPVLDTSKFHGGAQSAKFIGSSQQAFLVAAV
ncbi:MAG TPA: hypothetical protein VGP93_00870, partial [Polyangiaceae bacterium]|nr:hypothetical protein [Polyangiaceae bacterium]